MGKQAYKERKPTPRVIYTKPYPICVKVVGKDLYIILREELFLVMPVKEASKLYGMLYEFFNWANYRSIRAGKMFKGVR